MTEDEPSDEQTEADKVDWHSPLKLGAAGHSIVPQPGDVGADLGNRCFPALFQPERQETRATMCVEASLTGPHGSRGVAASALPGHETACSPSFHLPTRRGIRSPVN